MPDFKPCSACGGTGRMGPFFPGGLSTICGNCTPTPDPTGKCGELVTVGRTTLTDIQDAKNPSIGSGRLFRPDSRFPIELVTRSQVVELLAEQNDLIDDLKGSLLNYGQRVSSLEADNATKDARVKELERGEQATFEIATRLLKEKEALEAKLAAAEKALTEIASFTQTTDLLWWQERARAALEVKP